MAASLQKTFNEINSKLTSIIMLVLHSDCSIEADMLELDDSVENYCGYISDLNHTISSILNETPSIQEKLVWYNNLVSAYNNFVAKTECYDGTSIEELLGPIFHITEDFIDNAKEIAKL